MVTAQNALPLTPIKTFTLLRDSLQVGRQTGCTCIFFKNALYFHIFILYVKAPNDSDRRLAYSQFSV